jgi:hypothetical protein
MRENRQFTAAACPSAAAQPTWLPHSARACASWRESAAALSRSPTARMSPARYSRTAAVSASLSSSACELRARAPAHEAPSSASRAARAAAAAAADASAAAAARAEASARCCACRRSVSALHIRRHAFGACIVCGLGLSLLCAARPPCCHASAGTPRLACKVGRRTCTAAPSTVPGRARRQCRCCHAAAADLAVAGVGPRRRALRLLHRWGAAPSAL